MTPKPSESSPKQKRRQARLISASPWVLELWVAYFCFSFLCFSRILVTHFCPDRSFLHEEESSVHTIVVYAFVFCTEGARALKTRTPKRTAPTRQQVIATQPSSATQKMTTMPSPTRSATALKPPARRKPSGIATSQRSGRSTSTCSTASRPPKTTASNSPSTR